MRKLEISLFLKLKSMVWHSLALGVFIASNLTFSAAIAHPRHVKHVVRHSHTQTHGQAQRITLRAKHKHLSQHQHKRFNHAALLGVTEDAPVLYAAAVPAYYNKPDYKTPVAKVTTVREKHLVNFVDKTVSTLHYSDYKLGGTKFDALHGVYVLDCSSFVDHILKTASPLAYSRLVSATGAESPSTQHYYDFFKDPNTGPAEFWNKVKSVQQLRPGDILVFRDKQNRHHRFGSGHVMVVMDAPTHNTDIFYVRVADSAPSRHSQDTRQIHEGGIGIGTMLLKVNPLTGMPKAYAWALGGDWNKNVNFAMARPLDTSDITGV